MRVRLYCNDQTLKLAQNSLFGLSVLILVFPASYSAYLEAHQDLLAATRRFSVEVTTVLREGPEFVLPPEVRPAYHARPRLYAKTGRMGCEPMRPFELDHLIQLAAQQHQVDERIIHSMVNRESGRRPCSTSPKGAAGLLQLMPGTARQLGVRNPYDPGQNIEAGTRLLKQLLVRYHNDLPQALAAYNAGAGAVDQYRGIPPIKETQAYVGGIMREVRMANLVE